jgi:hypothetical protein
VETPVALKHVLKGAAMNFGEWYREERRCGRKPNREACWNAALRHAESSPSASTNIRYATALDVFKEFESAGPHPFGNDQFAGWLSERLNPPKAADFA